MEYLSIFSVVELVPEEGVVEVLGVAEVVGLELLQDLPHRDNRLSKLLAV